eukprot:ctg_360.g243
MQRYPEQVLDGWQSGDRDDRQVHTVASALCDALLEVVRADCGELMALRQRVSCLQRAWQQWRTTFASWKARDQERLVAGMIEDAVATEQLLVSMLPAGRVDASAVAAAEAVAAEWTPEIDRQLDRIRRAVRRVGGAAAVARMQQACGAVHQSVSETIDESAENAALDAWTSDADVVLAHEMMVDVSGLLARRRRDAPSAASSGGLWQHVASLMKQCYFERIQEALEREQYDPVVLEAMRDVKLALLQLLPVHAEPVEEVAGDAPRDALRSYRQQCGQLRRAVQREVDIAHVRQRLSAAMAPQGGQVAESAARRRVAFEELTRLVFWALQVLLLVQMPDKDEALLREWTVGEAGGRLCETAVRTRLRQRLLPMMTTAVDAPDTVPVHAAAVCAVFRELLALCEDRQADVAVARVQRYAPLVQQFGPEWERARFLASGASLQRTEAWLMPFCGEDDDVQAPEVDLSRAVRSGLVHGILLAVVGAGSAAPAADAWATAAGSPLRQRGMRGHSTGRVRIGRGVGSIDGAVGDAAVSARGSGRQLDIGGGGACRGARPFDSGRDAVGGALRAHGVAHVGDIHGAAASGGGMAVARGNDDDDHITVPKRSVRYREVVDGVARASACPDAAPGARLRPAAAASPNACRWRHIDVKGSGRLDVEASPTHHTLLHNI